MLLRTAVFKRHEEEKSLAVAAERHIPRLFWRVAAARLGTRASRPTADDFPPELYGMQHAVESLSGPARDHPVSRPAARRRRASTSQRSPVAGNRASHTSNLPNSSSSPGLAIQRLSGQSCAWFIPPDGVSRIGMGFQLTAERHRQEVLATGAVQRYAPYRSSGPLISAPDVRNQFLAVSRCTLTMAGGAAASDCHLPIAHPSRISAYEPGLVRGSWRSD